MVGEAIRERRRAAGLTQAELAKKLNVKDSAVTRWEKGNREPDQKTVAKIAQILGTSVMHLLGESTAEPTTNQPSEMETLLRLVGDMARTMDQMAGDIKILRGEMTELKQQMGNGTK